MGETPVEEEMEIKRQVLGTLEETLAHKKLELSELKAELNTFLFDYNDRLSPLWHEHDKLVADNLEKRAEANPHDEELAEQAFHAREQEARASAARDQAAQAHEPPPPASKELKDLYRQLCRENHPDTAKDDDDRARREKNMRRINDAYERRDLAALKAIAAELAADPDAVKGDSEGDSLVRIILLIARVKAAIKTIDAEIAALKESEEWRLYVRVKEERAAGQRPFDDMEARLLDDIDKLRV